MSKSDPVIPNQVVYIAAGAAVIVACAWGFAFLTQPKPTLRMKDGDVVSSPSSIAPLCFDANGAPIDCSAQKNSSAAQMQANAERERAELTMDQGCHLYPQGFWRYADGSVSQSYDQEKAQRLHDAGLAGFQGAAIKVDCPKR